MSVEAYRFEAPDIYYNIFFEYSFIKQTSVIFILEKNTTSNMFGV